MEIIESPMGYAVKTRIRGKLRLTNQHRIEFFNGKRFPVARACRGHSIIEGFKIALIKAKELSKPVLCGGNGRYITVMYGEDISTKEKLTLIAEKYKKLWWKLCLIGAEGKGKKVMFYRKIRKVNHDPNG